MWTTMGYNDGGELNLHDSFNAAAAARKLRPLIPRPLQPSSTSSQTATTNPNPPCLMSRNSHPDFLAQYHHLAAAQHNISDYHHQNMMMMSKRSELSMGQQVVVSSRWNPTPEQLRALEELYRRGTRTPSAEQIQHITAQLRRYGKIEGKNVFYWFQNHKARERQKRRRQIMESSSPEDLEMSDANQKNNNNNNKEITLLESCGNKTAGYEVEQTKNWAPTSTTLAEDSIQIRGAKGAVGTESCRTDGWIPLGEGELQQRRNFMQRNATWQSMQLSCLPPSPLRNCHVITTTNDNNNTNTTVMTSNSGGGGGCRRSSSQTMMGQQIWLNVFKTTPYGDENDDRFNSNNNNNKLTMMSQQDMEAQTLELFPLRSGDYYNNTAEKENEAVAAGAAVSTTGVVVAPPPCQFIEFLPLKQY